MSMFLIAAAALAAMGHPEEGRPEEGRAEVRFERMVDAAMREGEPWLRADERALIERACGYPRGSFDGRNIIMTNGVLTCENGRRVNDPEVVAMVDRMGERISRRVQAVMASPAVRHALTALTDEAVREALARVRDVRAPRTVRRR